MCAFSSLLYYLFHIQPLEIYTENVKRVSVQGLITSVLSSVDFVFYLQYDPVIVRMCVGACWLPLFPWAKTHSWRCLYYSWTMFIIPGCTFPLFLFLFVSGSARTNASNTAQPRPVRADQRGPPERPLLSVRIHLFIAAGRALSHVPVREPVHAAQQYHGHREHLRAGGSVALQRRGVVEKHPFLSRPADHRPGVPSQADVERVVCA